MVRRIAIRAEGISKRYRYGSRLNTHPTLRESITSGVSRLFGSKVPGELHRESVDRTHSSFWALRDISFQVAHGESLGIIGNNGAGKSTLLKILSRITEPTEGYAEIRGHIGSLLEVGTGFHPELTGRENVFLNGAIIGMKRSEIISQFDEIVDFAEVERFIDTPVKFYSSGMYLRLAFAVAAHLEPEILVVDEVLAVGDAAFQKKCLGKISHERGEGRTVLFVSHNMAVIRSLCSRAILIQDGMIISDGVASEVVATYLKQFETNVTNDLRKRTGRSEGRARLVGVEVSSGGRELSHGLMTGQSVCLCFHVEPVRVGISCSFTIFDPLGQPVTYFDTTERGQHDLRDVGNGSPFCCEIDEVLLVPGRYRIDASVYCDGELHDHVEAAAFLEMQQGILRGRLVQREPQYGSVIMNHRWKTPV